jgi:phage head maturation protease
MTVIMTEPVVETRAAQVANVDFPKRLVTVVAMPYEQPTQIHEPGRSYTEVVSRGAFQGIEKRTKQVRVNRDHSWDKLVGKVVALHPSRSEGLVTELKIFPTDIGERTLIDCDQGGLDASAGFGLLRRDEGRGPIWEDAEVWERNRTVRRLNRLWLDHLALVPNPAYEGAQVLSVRDAAAGPLQPGDATPNRDRLVIERLQAEKAALDRRWLV